MGDDKLPTRIEISAKDGKIRLDNVWDDLLPAIKPGVETFANLFGIAAKISGVTAEMIIGFVDRMRPIYHQAIEVIPLEHRQQPPLRISTSIIEESVKCMQEEELHVLFANLLAAASDDRRAGELQPGFATTIGQLTPLDAKLIGLLKSGSTLSQWRVGHLQICSQSEFEVSAANLLRLGLVEWEFERPDTWLASHAADDFERVKIKAEGQRMGSFSSSIRIEPDGLKDAAKQMADRLKEAIEKSHARAGIHITEYGRLFAKACIEDSASEAPDATVAGG
jgi:hypothetical protein